MKHQTPTIVLTGGGSGGHITPLLSLARELKNQSPDCQIVYVGQKGDNFDTFKQSGHDFDFMAFIKAGKFRRYHGKGSLAALLHPRTLALNIRDFFRLPTSFITAWRLLGKFEPDVVFSKGGFVAVPVGLAAHLRGVPIVTHDSDTMPGLANRIIGRWAVIHATGMPAEFYSYPKDKTAYVGIPLDERIKKVTPKLQAQVKKELGLPPDSKVILLSGGGNGSKRLNELMASISEELLKTDLSIYILHLSGRAHEAEVKQSYARLPKSERQRVVITAQTPDFYSFAAAADLVITRAGASTLAELAAAGKTCIIIPAPFLAGGHQLKNAQDIAERDAAVILPEETTPDELLATVNSLLANDSRRFELARNLFALGKPDAAARLAGVVLNVAERNQ